jgi:hypothetical protein
MFEVQISSEARDLISRALPTVDGPSPGVMIHRVGAIADVARGTDGAASWKIERPHPWAITVGSFPTPDEDGIVVVDGIRVWLPLIPRPGEKGVAVTVRKGELYVEAIAV